MSRYIEVDDYRKKWADIFDSAYGDSCCKMFKKSIDEQPTVDVVEVVRCKDCKHFDNYTCINDYVLRNINDCGCYPSLSVYGDDYCSYGERSEE